MLLLAQSGFLMAQTETLVTPNGKKVKVFTNPITANNGLKAESGNIELGGALLKPTTIVTNSENTLTIDGLQVGANTDNVLVADPTGVLKWVTRASLGDNLGNHIATQTLNIQNWPINNDGNPNWGLSFSKNRDDKNVVAIQGAGLSVDYLDRKYISNLNDANMLKFITVDAAGGDFKIITLKEVMQKSQEFYIIPEIALSDTKSTNGLQYEPIIGQLVYNSNDFMQNGAGVGLYYWGNIGGDYGWVPSGKDNLGNHTATQTLNIQNWPINNDGNPNWGLSFSKNRDDKNVVAIQGAGLSVDYLDRKYISNLNDANMLKFITVDAAGGDFKIITLKEVMQKSQEFYIIPQIELSDTKSTNGLQYEPIIGQLVYNANDAMQNGAGVGLYYWGNIGGDYGWVPSGKDNLGNHKATQHLDMGVYGINGGGGNWGLKFAKGLGDFDYTSKDYTNVNKYLFQNGYVVIEQLPNLKPNDPSERKPNGFDFVTRNENGGILRSTSLDEIMNVAQNQYFMPKISLVDNTVSHALANLLQLPEEGQFVYNINPYMQNGKGIGIYYKKGDSWVPLADPTPGDNLGNHTATQDLVMSTKNISGATDITASGTVTGDNLTATTKTVTPAAQISTGAGTGKIAVSDASGNLTWTDPSAITVAGDNLGNHIATQDLVMSSKNISGAANVTASGTVTGTNLTATTKTVTPAVQITNGAGAGKIAVSDASGNLVWTNASPEGILISSYTGPLASAFETPYPLNVSTNLLESNRTITVDKPSRIIITGSLTVAAKSNTMGTGDIIIKQNGTRAEGFGTSLKYSVFNPIMNGLGEIDPNLCLSTRVSFEANVDVEPGSYTFSVDILPAFSAPINTQENYAPEHYCPVIGNYISYKVYNK